MNESSEQLLTLLAMQEECFTDLRHAEQHHPAHVEMHRHRFDSLAEAIRRWQKYDQIESLPAGDDSPVDSGGGGGLTQADDDVLAYVLNFGPCELSEAHLVENAATVFGLCGRGFLEIIGGGAAITQAGIKAGNYAPR